jgi:outer membrane protein OmpA-like peptidoglycan-associated protein
MWIQMQYQKEQVKTLNDQVEQITSRVNLLNDVVEVASARAVRAEENAQSAAEARDRAEQARLEAEVATAQAHDDARISAEQAKAARIETEKIRQEREQELDRLQQALSALVETRRTALGLVMNLGSDAIEFDFDKADLRPKNRELLSRIAGVLLTAKGYSIYVYGHTDDVGPDAYNWSLSERRARAVRDYLVQSGIDPGIITARGYGESSPRVSGTTPEARAMNRRVEIGIVDVALDVRGETRN